MDIWPHFILTLKVILIGFAVATALGMLLAALISQSGLVTRAISPVIIWLVITPLITLIPLLTLWLGYDPMQRVYVVIIQATPSSPSIPSTALPIWKMKRSSWRGPWAAPSCSAS